MTLRWGGLPLLISRDEVAVELRSLNMVIPALRPDFPQEEQPGQVAVSMRAEVRWQPHVDDPADRVQWLPAAVVLDVEGREIRLELADADALAAALRTLVGSAGPAAQPERQPAWVEQPCLVCGDGRATGPLTAGTERS